MVASRVCLDSVLTKLYSSPPSSTSSVEPLASEYDMT